MGPELLESDVHSKYEPVIENMCQAGFMIGAGTLYLYDLRV